jgi:hypothetical protein
MTTNEKLKLNLLENSYDYLTASLEYVIRARKDKSQVAWKFAILNLVFAIELLLKERLRKENPLLIYADLDKFRAITRETKTISWTVLIERNKYVLGQKFIDLDSGRLQLAQRLRNQMLHYDVILEFPNVFHDFANLLNFFTNFYNTEISLSDEDTLHNHVPSHLWREESDISEAFIENVVYYNNMFVSIELRDEILSEQYKNILLIDGKEYERIRYGSSLEGFDNIEYAKRPCHDCQVVEGQIHLLGCDMERCPKCRNQLISCNCEFEYSKDIS